MTMSREDLQMRESNTSVTMVCDHIVRVLEERRQQRQGVGRGASLRRVGTHPRLL